MLQRLDGEQSPLTPFGRVGPPAGMAQAQCLEAIFPGQGQCACADGGRGEDALLAASTNVPLPSSVRPPQPETTPEMHKRPPATVTVTVTAPFKAKPVAIVAPSARSSTVMRSVTARGFPVMEKSPECRYLERGQHPGVEHLCRRDAERCEPHHRLGDGLPRFVAKPAAFEGAAGPVRALPVMRTPVWQLEKSVRHCSHDACIPSKLARYRTTAAGGGNRLWRPYKVRLQELIAIESPDRAWGAPAHQRIPQKMPLKDYAAGSEARLLNWLEMGPAPRARRLNSGGSGQVPGFFAARVLRVSLRMVRVGVIMEASYYKPEENRA